MLSGILVWALVKGIGYSVWGMGYQLLCVQGEVLCARSLGVNAGKAAAVFERPIRRHLFCKSRAPVWGLHVEAEGLYHGNKVEPERLFMFPVVGRRPLMTVDGPVLNETSDEHWLERSCEVDFVQQYCQTTSCVYAGKDLTPQGWQCLEAR